VKTFTTVVLATVLTFVPGWAGAQTPTPLIRGDVSGLIGWLGVEEDSAAGYAGNDWHTSLFGTISAGWHWTDHLKAEVDFGAGTESSVYRVRPVVFQGHTTFRPVQSRVSQKTFGISQQYQFFRNAWFHPHVAVGANITWAEVTDRLEPLVIYRPDRPPTAVEPGRTEGPTTDVTVRPFISSGFKAYFTQRGFFRTDLRFAFRDGIDEVLLRVGFGVDF
jgi:hypothetical protein